MSSTFSFLSGAYHLAYYFPRKQGNSDAVSEYILHFKDNKEPFTTKWIALATREVSANIKNINIVVRVLGSTELTASGYSSLDKLGASIAKHTNSVYVKSALNKKRQTRPLKFLSRVERQQELNGLYTFKKPTNISSNNPNILLIDDIVTSGTTLNEVNRAIKAVLPKCRLFFFSIGKTYDNWRDGEVTNSTILKEFRKLANEIIVSRHDSLGHKQKEDVETNGCFIITAVYQDANHPEVDDFRIFRDNWLYTFPAGRAFIKYYYKQAPFLALILNKSTAMQKIVLFSLVNPIHSFITRFIIRESNNENV